VSADILVPLPTTTAEPLTFHGRPLGRIPVETYEAMIDSGLLAEGDRLELIEGALVARMTKGRRHLAGSVKCRDSIAGALPAGWHARAETPVRLPARDSMPEPDVSVARGGPDDYLDLDPGPPDVALVVEVSDATLAADRALAATYLGGGIPTYWLLNVRDRQLEVYAEPGAAPTIVPESGSVELILDGRPVAHIPLVDMLPRP
jgi:Uma2 family endonuclease